MKQVFVIEIMVVPGVWELATTKAYRSPKAADMDSIIFEKKLKTKVRVTKLTVTEK